MWWVNIPFKVKIQISVVIFWIYIQIFRTFEDPKKTSHHMGKKLNLALLEIDILGLRDSSEWHTSERHSSEWHSSEWHSSEWHSSEWHSSELNDTH